MKNALFITLLASLLLAACGKTRVSPDREVRIGDLYALNLPGNFQPSYDLHDFASLQYADPGDNQYLIGLEESKKDLRNIHLYYALDEYAHFSYRTLAEGMDTVESFLKYPMQVNGLECIVMQIQGQQTRSGEQTGIFYNAAVYESDSHFYQLIAWSTPDQAENLQTELRVPLCSFRELPEEPLLTQEGVDSVYAANLPIARPN